jgi:hypothetical protein
MTDNPPRALSTSRATRPWSSTRPPTKRTYRSRPALILRREQRAPIGDGIKDLRPLTRAPYRALLDPAAYLDAPKNRRRTPREKINYKNTGLTGPAPSGMTPEPGNRFGAVAPFD